MLIVTSLMFHFVNIFVYKNYVVTYEVPCDPENDKCFVNKCLLDGGSDCYNEGDINYFKIISKSANLIKSCDVSDPSCENNFCKEEGCSVEYCEGGELLRIRM